jgi:hypothetical protein
VTVGAELDIAAGLVQPRVVAQPEAHQAFVGATLPVQAEPQRLAVSRQGQRDPLVGRQLDRQTRRPASVQTQVEDDASLIERCR